MKAWQQCDDAWSCHRRNNDCTALPTIRSLDNRCWPRPAHTFANYKLVLNYYYSFQYRIKMYMSKIKVNETNKKKIRLPTTNLLLDHHTAHQCWQQAWQHHENATVHHRHTLCYTSTIHSTLPAHSRPDSCLCTFRLHSMPDTDHRCLFAARWPHAYCTHNQKHGLIQYYETFCFFRNKICQVPSTFAVHTVLWSGVTHTPLRPKRRCAIGITRFFSITLDNWKIKYLVFLHKE